DCRIMHLCQMLGELRTVCIESAPVHDVISLEACLADQVDHVKAESFDTFLHPKLQYLLDLSSDIFIFPVQIRLTYVEKMQIILVKFLYIFPCVSPELTLPVGRKFAVVLAFAEDEEIFII